MPFDNVPEISVSDIERLTDARRRILDKGAWIKGQYREEMVAALLRFSRWFAVTEMF